MKKLQLVPILVSFVGHAAPALYAGSVEEAAAALNEARQAGLAGEFVTVTGSFQAVHVIGVSLDLETAAELAGFIDDDGEVDLAGFLAAFTAAPKPKAKAEPAEPASSGGGGYFADDDDDDDAE